METDHHNFKTPKPCELQNHFSNLQVQELIREWNICGGQLKVVYATDQSYVHFVSKSNQKQFWFAISAKKSEQHKKLMHKLCFKMQSLKTKLTKSQAIAMRDELLSSI